MLLLKFLQLKSTWPWSLFQPRGLASLHLLTYRVLWASLDAPFERPLRAPGPTQAMLFAT